MNRNEFVLFIGCLLMLGMVGCPRSPERESYAGRLDLDWSSGTSWQREVTIWPHRISHPEEAGDTALTRVWSYDVRRDAHQSARAGWIEARLDRDRYIMPFSPQYDVAAVKLIEEYSVAGVAKTTQVGRNPGWSGGGPFYPTSIDPDVTNVWFLPSLSGRELNEWQRFPILAGQRSTGRWIEQKVTRIENGLRFILRNRDRTQKIEFDWYQGEPWWARVVWYRHRRVVGFGERVTGMQSPSSR